MSTNTLSAEIIAIGTELLMGEVVNSNATYLSKELAQLGINVYYHSTVGDNPERIKAVVKQAINRANCLIFTGGLGPTEDDLTIRTLSELLDDPLIVDPISETQIKQFFISRDIPFSQTNLKQALRPGSAQAITNAVGTAPGLFWDITERLKSVDWAQQRSAGPCLMMAMPGVPREMKKMWAEEITPKLQPYLPNTGVLVSQSLKFFGIGESRLADMLSDLMALSSPTVSPYVGEADVRIRMAVRAETVEDGLKQLAPIKKTILERAQQYAIGENDDVLESLVGEQLKQQGLSISVAESCTGGLVSSRLTDIAGSSDYIKLNVVTYSNDAKTQVLGVDPALLEQYGAVSEAVAIAMADGVQRLSGSDMAISLTGIAGPTGGSDEKPVGLVYIGLAQTGHPTQAFKALVNPKYARSYIKYWFSQYALYYAYQRLSEVSSHVVQTLT